ncbi:hypothetical protein [Clostridium sp. UBA6640]|uniref:hypothetical protein n=1 Tax=Clostridium sp. UBA6640 TaxID=1946370 RepID=UPI0025C1B7F6|nr:hypothetical protein [Clostridium sp. UBA6640]
MNPAVIYIAGIILAVINGYLAIKKIFIDSTLSEKGIKNVVLILCIALSLYCSIMVVIYSNACISNLDIYNEGVKTGTLAVEKLEEIDDTIKMLNKYNIEAIMIGYLGLIFSYLLLRNIKKEIIKKLNSPKKKWNWDEIDN